MDMPHDASRYLQQLFQSTEGQANAQVSMFEVGATIGMDKGQAGKIAEELIGNGYVEVKTLSGGIGITDQGIAAVRTDEAAPAAADDLTINSGPVLNDTGRQAVETVLSELRTQVAAANFDYERIEELVMDIKTIEVQLLSPKPKTAIIREVLMSLRSALEMAGEKQIASRLGQMTAK
jgi:hypothetical protein